MPPIRYAAAIAATITMFAATEAPAQGPADITGEQLISMALVPASGPRVMESAPATEMAPAPATRRSRNPYPAAAATLLERMGCGDSDEFQARRERFRSAVARGMDVCVALARYGQPSSVTISDFGYTELATMVWGSVGGSYGVHVSATTYKDHPLTYGAGKENEIGTWRITRLFGPHTR